MSSTDVHEFHSPLADLASGEARVCGTRRARQERRDPARDNGTCDEVLSHAA
jgi:hypothetical protein